MNVVHWKSPRAVVYLNDYLHQRTFVCSWYEELEDVDLISIADILDEKRLSSMAAHPSNWRRWSPKLSEYPMLGEELM
jgi:hypothetical protein